MDVRKRIHEVLDVAKPDDRASRNFDIFILSLIGLNVIALILETVESIRVLSPPFFDWFEVFSVMVFTVEYLLRLWSCTVSADYRSPIVGRLRYAATPLAVMDLLAILPFYIPCFAVDLRVFRAVRLFRLFRVAKLGRYSTAIRTLGSVCRSKKPELLATVFILFLLVLMASSLMYFAEHEEQPEKFSSIPVTTWWVVSTLTTIGYGDVYPVTLTGRLLACVIAILGIGMFALPTGILGAGFVEEVRRKRTMPKRCPHCGRALAG